MEEKKQKEIENKQRKRDEEIRNQRELERYEKMFQSKKKNNKKKVQEETREKSIFQKYWLVGVFVVLIAVAIYFVKF